MSKQSKTEKCVKPHITQGISYLEIYLQELKLMKKPELLKLATEHNIVGRWEMSKAELLKQLTMLAANTAAGTAKEAIASYRDYSKIVTCEHVEMLDTALESIHRKREEKRKRILASGKGTLVAFTAFPGTCNQRVISAAINRIDKECSRLEVVTAYGAKHAVDFDNVLWVKTGDRWPSGVYAALKNQQQNGGEESHGR